MIFEFGPVPHGGHAHQVKEQANITAVLVHDEDPPKTITVLLDHMKASGKWATIKLPVDQDIAYAFRCIKIPSLIMYNSQNEETARVYGDQNIHDLLHKVME